MRHLLPILLLAGCAGPAPSACEGGMRPVREIAGFFGRRVTQAGAAPRPVTDAEWQAFLAEEIVPRFPAGSTVTAARGTWRHPATGGAVTEESAVLLLVVPEAEAGQALSRLAAAAAVYRQRHRQDAVGILARPACAAGFF